MKTPKTSLLARMKAKKADPKKKPMTVEGSAARPRLDRPMRMKRADGGPTISDDSKKEAARLEEESNKKYWGGLGAGNLGNLALFATTPGARGLARLGNGAKYIGAGAGWGLGAHAVKRSFDDSTEARRIKEGKAEPGKEDRKRGGKVGK